MGGLWDEIDATSTTDNPTNVIAIKAPNDIVVEDLINNEKIRSETLQLRKSMFCSGKIVVAAFKVADYVPNLATGKTRDFWEKQVSRIEH